MLMAANVAAIAWSNAELLLPPLEGGGVLCLDVLLAVKHY